MCVYTRRENEGPIQNKVLLFGTSVLGHIKCKKGKNRGLKGEKHFFIYRLGLQ